MNNTKWDEMRLAMCNLGNLAPEWRTKDVSGYLSSWDGEWFYHFCDGDYASIEWVDVRVSSPEQEIAVLGALRRIHLPGHRVESGFRIYGYTQDGFGIDYV